MVRLLSVAVSLVVTTAYAQDASIRVGGSTTALPIISSCAAHFMEKFASWDKADRHAEERADGGLRYRRRLGLRREGAA